MPIKFNPETGYYEEDGERRDVGAFIESYIDSSEAAIQRFTDRLVNGSLSVSVWNSRLSDEIVNSFIALYLLGRGGESQMTDSDWVAVAALIDRQDYFLTRFSTELSDGLVSEAETLSRAKMYANAARQSYYKALSAVATGLGNDQEKWYTRPVKTEHCRDCVKFEGQGWVTLGTFPEPGDGSTQCVSNCRCYKVFRNSETGVEYGG